MSDKHAIDSHATEEPACNCTHSLSMFAASLIPQDWMKSASHVPAVRCQCGQRYWSFSERKSFNSKCAAEEIR